MLELIKNCEEYLDEEAKQEVMHFYSHGEYEMSLEGLLLEMIKIQKYPSNIAKERISELAVYYHLDSESVFDYEFWKKYLIWIGKK